MQNALKKLYYQHINPDTQKFKRTFSICRSANALIDYENRLLALLEGRSEQKLFLRILGTQDELLDKIAQKEYADGFQLGIKTAYEKINIKKFTGFQK